MGEAGGKTGAGTWASRSEIQRKQMHSTMRGERRPRKHISVHAGWGQGQGWEGTKIMNEKESGEEMEGMGQQTCCVRSQLGQPETTQSSTARNYGLKYG